MCVLCSCLHKLLSLLLSSSSTVAVAVAIVYFQGAVKAAQAAAKAKADAIAADIKAAPANLQKEVLKRADSAVDEVSFIKIIVGTVTATIPVNLVFPRYELLSR